MEFFKLFVYALDGIVAFSTALLVIASLIGMLFCLLAFLLIVFIVIRTLVFGDPVAGWPSMFCLIMLLGGGGGSFCAWAFLASTWPRPISRPRIGPYTLSKSTIRHYECDLNPL